MNIRSVAVSLALVALASTTLSPALGAMRAPLWVWIAGVGLTQISDTDCTAKGGKIAKHPGEGDKLFCDLPATPQKAAPGSR